VRLGAAVSSLSIIIVRLMRKSRGFSYWADYRIEPQADDSVRVWSRVKGRHGGEFWREIYAPHLIEKACDAAREKGYRV